LCIDACNNIMDSMGWKRGLIRYDSERNLNSDHPVEPHIEWKRLKVIGYASALLVMVVALVYSIGTQTDSEVRIAQVRQPLYVHLSDDRIRNRYELHIVNKTEHEESYEVQVRGVPQEALDMGVEQNPVVIRAGKDLRFTAKVDLEEKLAKKTREFEFVIRSKSAPAEEIVRKVSFSSEHREHEDERKNEH